MDEQEKQQELENSEAVEQQANVADEAVVDSNEEAAGEENEITENGETAENAESEEESVSKTGGEASEAPETPAETQEEIPENQEQEDAGEDNQTQEEPAAEPSEDDKDAKTTEPDLEAEAQEDAKEEKVEDAELEKVRAELEDAKAELEEREAIEKLNKNAVEANAQMTEFLDKLGKAMVDEFKKFGINPDETLEKLESTDAAKANVAKGIIAQAQKLKDEAVRNMSDNIKAEFDNVVFNKAARLFEKFELNEEQAQIAAETFIDIMEQSGIRDFKDDIKAKVELAVARARMISPKVVEVASKVAEIVQDVQDTVEEILDKPEGEEEAPAENAAEQQADKEEKPEISVVEEAPTVDEFMEGAQVMPSAPSDAVTVENALLKLNSIKSDKDRMAFYKAHFNVIEEACRRRTDRK